MFRSGLFGPLGCLPGPRRPAVERSFFHSADVRDGILHTHTHSASRAARLYNSFYIDFEWANTALYSLLKFIIIMPSMPSVFRFVFLCVCERVRVEYYCRWVIFVTRIYLFDVHAVRTRRWEKNWGWWLKRQDADKQGIKPGTLVTCMAVREFNWAEGVGCLVQFSVWNGNLMDGSRVGFVGS